MTKKSPENTKRQDSNGSEFTLSDLEALVAKLSDYPDEITAPPREIFQELKQVLAQLETKDKERDTEAIKSLFQPLQDKLQSHGVEIGDLFELIDADEIQKFLASPQLQPDIQALASQLQTLQELEGKSEAEIEHLQRQLSAEIISPLVDKILKLESEDFWEQKRQEYRKSAQKAIAKSFESIQMPSFTRPKLDLNSIFSSSSATTTPLASDGTQVPTTEKDEI